MFELFPKHLNNLKIKLTLKAALNRLPWNKMLSGNLLKENKLETILILVTNLLQQTVFKIKN